MRLALLMGVSLAWGGSALGAEGAGAFAALGVAKEDGKFAQYPPFYDSVIWPHGFGAGGKIFIAFQDTVGRPVAMGYDTAARRWDGPVRVSEFGLGKDAHGNPAITVDRDGFVHVFYGCHVNPMRHARSRKPRDISTWEEMPSAAPKATYPQAIRMAGDEICLFYRAGGHMEPWTLRVRPAGGGEWSAPEPVIEMRLDPPDKLAAAYCSFVPGAERKTIHCFWSHKDDNAARVTKDKPHPWRPLKYPGLHEAVYRYNVYYISRDGSGVWRNARGEKVPLPVTKATADRECLVYDSGDIFTGMGRSGVDAKDRPHVSFRTGVGDWKNQTEPAVPWRTLFADWDGGAWRISEKLPEDWPASVRALRNGSAVDGEIAASVGRGVPWTISFDRVEGKADVGCVLYLRDGSGAVVPREGGPARVGE